MAASLSSTPFMFSSFTSTKQPYKPRRFLTLPPQNTQFEFSCCYSSPDDSTDLVHEAIAREESEEFRVGIVSEEFRRGFLLGDRLLRPAIVKVSYGPGKKKDIANKQQSSEQSVATATVAVDEH